MVSGARDPQRTSDEHDGVDAKDGNSGVGTVPDSPPRSSKEVVDLGLVRVKSPTVLRLAKAWGQVQAAQGGKRDQGDLSPQCPHQ